MFENIDESDKFDFLFEIVDIFVFIYEKESVPLSGLKTQFQNKKEQFDSCLRKMKVLGLVEVNTINEVQYVERFFTLNLIEFMQIQSHKLL